MKALALIFCSIMCTCAFGQQAPEVMQKSDKQLLDCRRAIDTEIFPSETCSVILSYMSPTDQIGPVNQDGSFIVLSPLPDGKMDLKTYQLPPKLRSEIALNQLRETIGDAQYMGSDMHGLFAELAIKGVNFWPKVRDVYCYYHPKEKYLGLSGEQEECPVGVTLPNGKALEGCFEGPLVFSINYHTFLNSLQAEETESRKSQK